jgi:hypothetical protein
MGAVLARQEGLCDDVTVYHAPTDEPICIARCYAFEESLLFRNSLPKTLGQFRRKRFLVVAKAWRNGLSV